MQDSHAKVMEEYKGGRPQPLEKRRFGYCHVEVGECRPSGKKRMQVVGSSTNCAMHNSGRLRVASGSLGAKSSTQHGPRRCRIAGNRVGGTADGTDQVTNEKSGAFRSPYALTLP